MKGLLNNERAPLTFGGGFIEISFSEYCNAFTSWWKGLEIDFESFSFEAVLKEAMLRLEPLQNPQNRYLITETQSNWTVIFSNSRGGSDVTSAVSYLCEVLRVPWSGNTVFSEYNETRGEQDLHWQLRTHIVHY